MHHRTAWSKASSVPSDRLKPKQPSRQASPQGKAPAKDAPKSKEILRLEGLVAALQASSGTEQNPKGGCFCQGRLHLSFTMYFIESFINLQQPEITRCPHIRRYV